MVLSLGFAWLKQYPPELMKILPVGSYTHTCDIVDFEFLRAKRVLVVGGRQSAFEWAALMREKGADEVYVTHRHATLHRTGLELGTADGAADAGRPRLVAVLNR